MEQHIVKASWKEGVHFEAETPGGIINMDGADEIGGKGKGYRPKALMLSAMAGCTGIDVSMLIEKMRVQIDGFSIDVSAELTNEHPKIYQNTHIIFTFKSANPDKEKIEKAVNLSFDKYCGVIAMFKSFSNVTKEIRYVA